MQKKLTHWGKLRKHFGFGDYSKQDRLAPHRGRTLRLEPLEDRSLLTVLYWDPDCSNNGSFGGTGNWSTTNAWVDASGARYTWNSSRSGDEAVFKGTAGTVTLTSAISALKINFQDVDGYVIGGSSYALTLTNSGLAIAATVSAAINCRIVDTGTSQQWSVASGKTLAFSNTVTYASRELFMQGPGTCTFSGSLSGGAFGVGGYGTATFTGSCNMTNEWNIFTGNVTSGAINWNSTGTASAGCNVLVGYNGGSGVFTQTAGLVCSPSNFDYEVSGSVYNLYGGTLRTPNINYYASGATPAGCSINFAGGTLLATGNLTASSGLSVNISGSANSVIDTGANSVSLAGSIQGDAVLVKSGTGSLTISGAANNIGYFGVWQGSVSLGSNLNVGALTIYNSASVKLNNYNATVGWIANGSSAETIQLGSGTLAVGDSSTRSFSGVISGTGSVVKKGSGTLTLSSVNTYTGGTRIEAGILSLSGATNRLATTGNITVAGGTLDFGGYGQTTSGVVNFVDADGGVIQNGTLTLTNSGLAIAATVSAAINCRIVDTGTSQQWSVASGKTLAFSNTVTYASRELFMQGPGTCTFSGSLSGGAFGVGGYGTATFTGSCNMTNEWNIFTGNVTSGAINWNSTGTASAGCNVLVGYNGGSGVFTQTAGLVCSPSNFDYEVSGSVYNLYGGTLRTPNINYYASGATPAGCSINFAGGTLQATGNLIAGSNLSYTSAFATTSSIDTNGYSVSLAGNVTGQGTLTKSSSGTLALSGVNSLGQLTVNAGTVQLGSASALTAGTNVVLNNSGVLNLNNYSVSIDSLASSSSSSSVTLGTGTLTINADIAQTFAGGISGAGALIKTGSAIQTFTGVNTYVGGTTINGGTLQLGNGTTSGSIVGNVANNSVLVFNEAANAVFSGNISGTGTVTKIGSATLSLSGVNTVAKLKIDAGTVKLGSASALSAATDVTINNSGVLNLNNYSVNVGSLDSSSATSSVALGTATLTVNADEDCRFAGVIGGTGAVVKQGDKKLTFTNANIYTGGTTIQAGALQLGDGATDGTIVGNVTNNGSLIFAEAADAVFSANISGTGTVAKIGAASLSLGGTNSFSQLSIDEGTVSLGGASAFSSGAALTFTGSDGVLNLNGHGITVGKLESVGANAAGAVLLGDAAITINSSTSQTFAGDISGDGSVTKTGAGVQTFSGTNTYTGGTYVNAGTLALGSATALPTGSMLAAAYAQGNLFVNGGTLDLGGFVAEPEILELNGGAVTNGVLEAIFRLSLYEGEITAELRAHSAGASITKQGTGDVTITPPSGTSLSGFDILVWQGNLDVDGLVENGDVYVRVDNEDAQFTATSIDSNTVTITETNYEALTATAAALTTVSSVTSPNASGTYTVGDVIYIDVTFTTPVMVCAEPQLLLNTGASETRIATYVSGTGTNTLRFAYTVQTGDDCAALDYSSTTALQILDSTGMLISPFGFLSTDSLVLAEPGTAGSLSASCTITLDA